MGHIQSQKLVISDFDRPPSYSSYSMYYNIHTSDKVVLYLLTVSQILSVKKFSTTNESVIIVVVASSL